MAVFTEITSQDVVQLLENYKIGDFVDLKGISAGIENSNFYLQTTKGRWVLTVFERLSIADLPFYLELCRHLGDRELPVSCPEKTKEGMLYSMISGKPCSIALCFPGKTVDAPTTYLCQQLGSLLARMHLSVKDFHLEQENTRGLNFWIDNLSKLEPHIPASLFSVLKEEIERQIAFHNSSEYRQLEKGAVHADLFRNNALAQEDRLCGIIDFYFACTAPLLYDLAVTMNDWCIDLETGEFDHQRAQTMIEAYHAVRPLSDNEKQCWKDMLCASSLRFWVSRLYDFYLPRQASLLKPLDPSHFERILKLRRLSTPEMLPWPKTIK